MKLILSIIVLGFLYSCGQHSDSRNLQEGDKRPLKIFSEADVVRYAVAVFNKKPEQDFEVKKNDDGFSVVGKENATGLRPQYKVKIGAHGLILYKDDNGKWIDRFEDRRIFYYEQDNKLILSEIFEGDSITYHEFTK